MEEDKKEERQQLNLFAAFALQGILSSPRWPGTAEDYVRDAWTLAHAMMEGRVK